VGDHDFVDDRDKDRVGDSVVVNERNMDGDDDVLKEVEVVNELEIDDECELDDDNVVDGVA
jgi:hypothetical protein